MLPDHDQRSGQVAPPGPIEQSADRICDGRAAGHSEAEDGDPGVSPRWVPTYVTEAHIEGDQEAALPLGGCEDVPVGRAEHPFVGHRVDVVAERLGCRSGGRRQVLVELELQPELGSNGYSSSWASREA